MAVLPGVKSFEGYKLTSALCLSKSEVPTGEFAPPEQDLQSSSCSSFARATISSTHNHLHYPLCKPKSSGTADCFYLDAHLRVIRASLILENSSNTRELKVLFS